MAKRFFWFVLVAVAFMVTIGLWGCSRRSMPPVVTETHTSLSSDSLTGFMARLLLSQQILRETESFDRTERFSETIVLNEQGDTTRHDTHSEVSTSYVSKLEKENRILRAQLDSISKVKSRVDSVRVPVPYPVEKIVEVERDVPWWQKALQWLGGACVALLIYVIYRKLKK